MTKRELIDLFETKAVPFADSDRPSDRPFIIQLTCNCQDGWVICTYDLGSNNREYQIMESAFQPVMMQMIFTRHPFLKDGDFSSANFKLKYDRTNQTIEFEGAVWKEQLVVDNNEVIV